MKNVRFFQVLLLTALFFMLPLGPHKAYAGGPLPDGVVYDGVVYPPLTLRGKLQQLLFKYGSAWATCDTALMDSIVTEDVILRFPGPFGVVNGVDKVRDNVLDFCSSHAETSVFFPVDAFAIDVVNKTVAAEVQFRTTRKNAAGTTQREVVNDVWHAQVDNRAGTLDFRITVIKEHLDGRVRTLQAQNVLQILEGETEPFLTPWPPFVPGREMCFPIVTNTCDESP
jgi:hypothetical protein